MVGWDSQNSTVAVVCQVESSVLASAADQEDVPCLHDLGVEGLSSMPYPEWWKIERNSPDLHLQQQR